MKIEHRAGCWGRRLLVLVLHPVATAAIADDARLGGNIKPFGVRGSSFHDVAACVLGHGGGKRHFLPRILPAVAVVLEMAPAG
jgi:hypothetical protein